jgi:hypothetical protein
VDRSSAILILNRPLEKKKEILVAEGIKSSLAFDFGQVVRRLPVGKGNGQKNFVTSPCRDVGSNAVLCPKGG